MRYIYLQPVGEVDKELLQFLCTRLKEIFRYPCKVSQPVKVPEELYNERRRQYNAAGIAGMLSEKMPDDAEKLLGIVDADLFVHGMNFVFGLASGSGAAIALARLRPEYYGENKNELLFRERALKEAVHELGHTFDLRHCPGVKCVMHFSNTLGDTDIKGAGFCKNCAAKIGIKSAII